MKPFDKEKIIKYEDFVERPEEQLKEIKEKLALERSSAELEYIDIFKISGISGRSGNEIYKRPRKNVSEELIQEIKESSNLKTLLELKLA